MQPSTVYFTDFRCPGTSLTEKLRRLCLAAGIRQIDMDGRFWPSRCTLESWATWLFLRPNYAKAVADLCKEQWYALDRLQHPVPRQPQNALEHLNCAQLNGFLAHDHRLPGADVSVAPTRWKCRCRGRVLQDGQDRPGHHGCGCVHQPEPLHNNEATGFGGTIKNIGMGCGSRAGRWSSTLRRARRAGGGCARLPPLCIGVRLGRHLLQREQ